MGGLVMESIYGFILGLSLMMPLSIGAYYIGKASNFIDSYESRIDAE